MLHQLTSWEDNGYNDSDFYVSVWDDEAREVRAIEVGSTRYASCGTVQCGTPIKSPDALADALQWLAGHIYERIAAAELLDVLEPQDAPLGAFLTTLRPIKPRNAAIIPAGTTGKVFWCGAYGQFYAKGYNRPCRGNRRVGLRLENGDSVYVALSACRLADEPLSVEDLASRAWDLAQNCGFSAATGVKCAWDSENYALALYQQVYAEQIARERAESWARVA